MSLVKKTIYSYFQGERRLIVDFLCRQYQWEPVFFHGSEGMEPWIKETYPKASFHDLTLLRQSHFDYSRVGKPVPIDAEIIRALSAYESNYLNWLQDTTGWNFSFTQRRRYYYEILKFWNSVIVHYKPEMYVSYNMPHLASDYPLYLLCKYYYHIPVVFMNPFPFLDGQYYAIGDSLEDLSSTFKAPYLSSEPLDISPPVKEYLAHVRGSEPTTPKHIVQYWDRLDGIKRARYQDFLKFVKMLLNGSAFQTSIMSFKKNQKPWESDEAKLTNAEYAVFKWQLARRNKALHGYYNTLVQPVDFKAKYIYFPAPYQPEVLSNLYAGVYEDVFLILDMISAIIPDDWVIYYKEHPNTFKEADKGGLCRDEFFYQKINVYKNVKVVAADINSFKLTDGAQAVCTVGGTAGWEAVVRGKPALVYGSLWYQACKSVFTIHTYADACQAMDKVIDGFVPDPADVDRYAEAVYRRCEHGLIIAKDFDNRAHNADDPTALVERVANAFYRAYQFSNNQKELT